MSSDNASFAFSFADGTLKIEGSELFVSQQVEIFREKIMESLSGLDQPAIALPQITGPQTTAGTSEVFEGGAPFQSDNSVAAPSTGNPYPRVLDVLGDKLKVTTSVKGKNTAERAVNLILIYLWGKERLLDQPTAEYRELREICEEHACLDSSNFSSTLTSKKNLILVDGSKGSSSKICKLTYPGREAAEEVLAQLNDTGK
ncbi:hypothetical protein [Ruegeria profundi]|uniref:hypothetical protein n=1 Tax=Ruegeria profundi TaxID=1685378 RepID=UPI001CD1CBB9|nr:hypothetical protein [Ruegeria profundi]MCA0930606.1 hypothetical protein [Ruegeria profundi]